MWWKILLALVVLLGGFLVYVASRPDEFDIARSVMVSASPEKIFPLINNGKRMDEWAAWQDLDPGVKITYSGPDEGVGSKSSWTSDGPMGHGSSSITESVPNKSVVYELEYTKPAMMKQTAELVIEPQGDQSKVTWSVRGTYDFMGKLVNAVMDMDAVIGKMFDDGLKNLKTMAENQPAEPATDTKPEADPTAKAEEPKEEAEPATPAK
jgi:uncharacterized protein YndB with AHSA1/START domain